MKSKSNISEETLDVALLTGRVISVNLGRSARILVQPKFLALVLIISLVSFPLFMELVDTRQPLWIRLPKWVLASCLSVLVYYGALYLTMVLWGENQKRAILSPLITLAAMILISALTMALLHELNLHYAHTLNTYFSILLRGTLVFEIGFTIFVYTLRDRLIAKVESDASLNETRLKLGKYQYMLDQILYFEAENQYVRVVTKSKTDVLSNSLAEISNSLGPQRAIRVHRSYLVMAHSVEGLERNKDNKLHLRLTSGDTVPVARRRTSVVRQRWAVQNAD